MPRKISIFCPFCHRHTSLEPARRTRDVGAREYSLPAIADGNDGVTQAWIAVCNFCDRFVFVVEDSYHREIFPTPQPSPADERI